MQAYANQPAPSKSTPAAGAVDKAAPKPVPVDAGYEKQAAALTPGAPPVGMPDPRAVVRELVGQGITSENEITNELFYRANEILRGTKLKPGTPEAEQWLGFRNEVVRPELEATKKAAKPDKDPEKKADDAAVDVPKPTPTPSGGGGAKGAKGAAKASASDKYYNQNDNSYDDDEAEWKGGSAGKNTCNMTALTMALVSIAGNEAVAKQGVVAFLRKKGVRSGGKAKIHGKWVGMDKILKSDELIADVQLEDLVIAAAVAVGGSYKSVTTASMILGIAKKTGLVKGGSTKGTQQHLVEPEVRKSAKEALDKGARIVAQTKGHYVYLVDVRDDGIVVHDPAGARIALDKGNLWPGKCSDKLGTWLGRLDSNDKRETALRRCGEEPANRAFIERAVAVSAMGGKEKKDEKAKLMAEFPAYLELGKNNFYSLDELAKYNARVGIMLEPSDKDDAAKKGEAAGE